jgi:hypothetical protein
MDPPFPIPGSKALSSYLRFLLCSSCSRFLRSRDIVVLARGWAYATTYTRHWTEFYFGSLTFEIEGNTIIANSCVHVMSWATTSNSCSG